MVFILASLADNPAQVIPLPPPLSLVMDYSGSFPVSSLIVRHGGATERTAANLEAL